MKNIFLGRKEILFIFLSFSRHDMSISMMSLSPSGKPMPPPVPPKPTIQNFPAFPQRISPAVPPKPRRAISTMALNSGPNR